MINKSTEFASREQQLASAAKALSHPARLEILKLLAGLKDCMCGDIVNELPLAQSTVSQHLKSLKEAGLIKGEINGPRTCYCIDIDAVKELHENIEIFFQEIRTAARNQGCC